MSYGWPVKPFDEQHPVRGFFCDPRIGAKGGKAFHFGVDVSAPDGTAVYAVEGGKVHSEGAQNVGDRRRQRPLARLLAHRSDGASWPAGEKARPARAHREGLGTRPLRRANRRQVREPAARRRADALQGLRRPGGRPDRRRTGEQAARPEGADGRREPDRGRARQPAHLRPAALARPARHAGARALAARARRTCRHPLASRRRLPLAASSRVPLQRDLRGGNAPEPPERTRAAIASGWPAAGTRAGTATAATGSTWKRRTSAATPPADTSSSCS